MKSLSPLLPPDDLDDQAREFWERIAPLLLRLGTLTEETRPQLERFCRAWMTMRAEQPAFEETVRRAERTYRQGRALRMTPELERLLTVTQQAVDDMMTIADELHLAEAVAVPRQTRENQSS